MTSTSIGEQYDEIASWWNRYQLDSNYGVAHIEKALTYAKNEQAALDVGCGSGGRFIHRLESRGFNVTGVDASHKASEAKSSSVKFHSSRHSRLGYG